MSGEYLPRFKPGATLPIPASANVRGGRLVSVSGAYTCAEATAGVPVLGVAGQDTNSGEVVTVHGSAVHELVAGGAIAAGAEIAAAADGKAVTYATGVKIGQALTAAAAGDALFLARVY